MMTSPSNQHNCWRYPNEQCSNTSYCGMLGQCGYVHPEDLLGKKSDKPSLINLDRMFRNLICENPTHPLVKWNTNELQPKCPICNNIMVAEIKSALTGETVVTPREK